MSIPEVENVCRRSGHANRPFLYRKVVANMRMANDIILYNHFLYKISINKPHSSYQIDYMRRRSILGSSSIHSDAVREPRGRWMDTHRNSKTNRHYRVVHYVDDEKRLDDL